VIKAVMGEGDCLEKMDGMNEYRQMFAAEKAV
jgi:hypothetical protein